MIDNAEHLAKVALCLFQRFSCLMYLTYKDQSRLCIAVGYVGVNIINIITFSFMYLPNTYDYTFELFF